LLYEVYFREKALLNRREEGMDLKKITGSHHIYQQAESHQILSIPVHANKDLKIGTLKALMKIADLTEEDL
jgi:predicted RNA binding protein YcfA (HicA-like mRNA interferase family)